MLGNNSNLLERVLLVYRTPKNLKQRGNELEVVSHTEWFHLDFAVTEQWVENNKHLSANPVYSSSQQSHLFQVIGIALRGIQAEKSLHVWN